MANTSYASDEKDAQLEDFGHPRGTLVIVAVFGAVFALAWLAFYLFLFLQRGAPHS